ncbi:hypothetical protein, partial [Winogradskyella sp.]|uniref:hypothetical protein n=1 Tax=Winogradskyella sp. TaxID=1883156 RepID=UPI0035144AF4
LTSIGGSESLRPLEPATSAFGKAWKNVSQWARYAGREIVVFAGKAAELTKVVLAEVVKLVIRL